MSLSNTDLRRIVRSASLYVGLLVLFAVGSVLSPQFLSIGNQKNVFWQVSINGIISVGMTLVILTAGIDLSVGSVLSFSTVVCAMLLMEREWTHATSAAAPSAAIVAAGVVGWIAYRWLPRRWRWMSLVVGAAILAGAIVWIARGVPRGFGAVAVLLIVPPVGLMLGAINGMIIAKGRLQPFIVTLGMMVSAVGLAKYVAGFGGMVHPVYFASGSEAGASESFRLVGSNIAVLGKDLIPVPGLFFAACAIAAWVLLTKLRIGRYIYAVGGNEETARLSGINTDRVRVFVYAAAGMLSALAGVLYCAQYQQGKADAGLTRELDAIAAVVIGGTSLMGGRGGIGGTVVGVFIFGYLRNIMNLRNVSTEFQDILQGLIIVLAVLLQEGVLARWIGDAARRLRGLRR